MSQKIMVLCSEIIIWINLVASAISDCTDIYGREITPNSHYIPGPDVCQLCVCDNIIPKWCKRVLCSPPQNCKSFVMGNSCCDYSCLDDSIPNEGLKEDLDRRFILSVGAIAVLLSLVLILVYKYRHRNNVAQIPSRNIRVNEDRANVGGNIGFIMNIQNGHHPFDEHPLVNFPLYKPNGVYYPRSAPPPYEEAIADTSFNIQYHGSQVATNDVARAVSERPRSNSLGVGPCPNHQHNTVVTAAAAATAPVVVATTSTAAVAVGTNGAHIHSTNNNTNSIAIIDSAATTVTFGNSDGSGTSTTLGHGQHRTIPMSHVCINPSVSAADRQTQNPAPVAEREVRHSQHCKLTHGRSMTLHKKSHKCSEPKHKMNSATQHKHCRYPNLGSTPYICPPQQFNIPVIAGGDDSRIVQSPVQQYQFHHRTLPLPLSSSLSSPLPSTSSNSDEGNIHLPKSTSSYSYGNISAKKDPSQQTNVLCEYWMREHSST